MTTKDKLILILWMYITQRNGKGPVKYLGLSVIDWIIIFIIAVLIWGIL